MSEVVSRRVSRALAALALVAAFYYALWGGEYTLGDVSELRDVVEERTAHVEGLESEVEAARAFGDSLESDPWVIEREARQRYNFVRPGETVFRFVETDAEPPEIESG